jgi:hypothetical protein
MTMAGIVLVIALVAVVIWMVTRGEDKVAAPKVTGPQLEVTGEKIVRPISTQSGYTFNRYEYAGLGTFRGDNIDFKIKIKTAAGFQEASITTLRIERNDASGNQLQTATIENINNYGEYEHTFKGLDLAGHAFATDGGKNTFNVYGVTKDGDYDGDAISPGTQPLTSAEKTVDSADLNYTIGAVKKENFKFNIPGGTGVEFSDMKIKRSKYELSIDPMVPYSIRPDTNGESFKFEKSDGTYLQAGDVKSFKIDKFGEKYRLYSGANILTREGGTGDLVLKDPAIMTAGEGNVALMAIVEFEIDDICITVPDLPAGSTWAFHDSAGASATLADLAFRWANDTVVNDKGESAKSLGYNWVYMTSDSLCHTYFLFGKGRPTEDVVDDKYCSYTNNRRPYLPQGVKHLCGNNVPVSKIDGHPSGVTWRCVKLDSVRAIPKSTNTCRDDCSNILISQEGKYRVVLQTDGNLTVKDASDVLKWSSGSSNLGEGPYRFVMQGDGNIAVRDSKNNFIWGSGTANVGTGPYNLYIQDDGNFAAYDSKGAYIWGIM